MVRVHLLSLAAFATASCASAPVEVASKDARTPAYEDRWLDRFTSPRLEKFASEKEFLDYVRRLQTEAQRRGEWWSGAGVQYAQLTPPVAPPGQPPCDPVKQPCPKGDPVVVTGSKIAAPSSAPQQVESVASLSQSTTGADSTITNVQTVGVDEGDIVKQVGKFLIVLQDGRLFSVDTSPAGGAGLKLADRANVYRNADEDTWYDEMLVSGRRILVTGYSYEEDASELNVFRIGEDGRFAREGTFYLSSNDYYDTENYATRLIGDKLVIYSPIYLTDVDPDEPMQWPVVRRWVREEDRAAQDGKRLFDARDVYKPVQPALFPAIHTVSVCRLGEAVAEKDLGCRSTAFVAPEDHVFYVSPTDVWLWIVSSNDWFEDTCKPGDASPFEAGVPAGVYRVPLSGAKPKMMHARGAPRDQFALDAQDGELRGLLMWGQSDCDPESWEDAGKTQLKYFHVPQSLFRDDIRTASRSAYTDAPAPGGYDFVNRFTDDYVVYGERSEGWDYPPEGDEPPREGKVTAIPVRRPSQASVLTAPHGMIRAERVGDDVLLTGYRDEKGLSLSYVDLTGKPAIASTTVLERRYETEGRSHAFNSRRDEGGSGLMGIPTAVKTEEAGRWWWRSDASDVSFLSFDAKGVLKPIGELTGREDSEDDSYECEVSCIDWYGNSRPIFIQGRIYALTGTELVEGAVVEGGMVEVRRLNLTAPLSTHTASSSR